MTITDPDQLVAQGAELFERGLVSEAASRYEQALLSQPAHLGALSGLANSLQAMGDHSRGNAILSRLLESTSPPARWRIASNHLVWQQYQPGITDEQLSSTAIAYGAALGLPVQALARQTCGDRSLRVGMLSGDLCDHPVGLLLLPLLRKLRQDDIQVVLFSTRTRHDATAGELRALAEWHDVEALPHEELLALLRRHALDVMVDLSGHTAGNRLPVLAQRVAPVQVSWLGYFATTGVPAIDHVLMDEAHVPAGHERSFTETLVRLPATRFCYEPVPFFPAVAPPPAAATGRVTFGSFNNTAKYNDDVLRTWAGVLARVPSSRLVLKWVTFADPAYRARVIGQFKDCGIDPTRIELRQASGHRQMLEEYADIDIALDPFPFSGGYTSCEALWSGLPVVTLPGRRPVSRQTFSILRALGRPDWLQQWTAVNAADYVDKAVGLASGPGVLMDIRASLRAAMAACPLTDARRFAQDWSAAIRSLAA